MTIESLQERASDNLDHIEFIRFILNDSLFQKTIRYIFQEYMKEEIEDYSL
jgi:hypothetical protein